MALLAIERLTMALLTMAPGHDARDVVLLCARLTKHVMVQVGCDVLVRVGVRFRVSGGAGLGLGSGLGLMVVQVGGDVLGVDDVSRWKVTTYFLLRTTYHLPPTSFYLGVDDAHESLS